MPWVKLDDQFFAHPKVIDLPKDAKLLFLCGLTHCATQLTDGFISQGAMRLIAATVDVAQGHAGDLVAAGLWEEVGGGFAVHDYLEYNPSGEQVKRDRALNARRQQDWREREMARKAAEAAASVTDGVTHAATNGVTNGVTPRNAVSNTRPVPVPVPVPRPHPDPRPTPTPAGVGGAGAGGGPVPTPKRADARPTPPTVDELVDGLRVWADEKGLGDTLRAEAERFRDYCLSKIDPATGYPPGSRKPLYTDYAAACRKWITNPSFAHTARAPARASPNGQHPSNEQTKFSRSVAALRGVGGQRESADIPDQHGEAGRRLLGGGHAREG
jgi:hypothetical protein